MYPTVVLAYEAEQALPLIGNEMCWLRRIQPFTGNVQSNQRQFISC